MSRVCQICGKAPLVGHKVSHSAHKTLRRFLPNLQRVRAISGTRHTRVRACTKCLKRGRVFKAV